MHIEEYSILFGKIIGLRVGEKNLKGGFVLKVRLGLLLFTLILALIPVYLILTNAFNYSPINPDERCQLPPDEKETYIIFLSGIDSSCDGTVFNQMGFEYLRRKLSQVGLSYKDEHFLMYSYTGGEVREGRWFPNTYIPVDTGQPIALSVMRLREMIGEFNRYHPRARFLLIGHSLGGRIAFDYAIKYHLERPGHIKGVITLNAPLIGTPYIKADIFAFVKPILSTPAVRQLMDEYQLRNESGILKQKVNAARRLTAEGIYLATFGTRQDIIVHPFSACITDEQGNPLTKGNIVSVNIFTSDFKKLSGHRQILTHKEVVKSIISIYTNPVL